MALRVALLLTCVVTASAITPTPTPDSPRHVDPPAPLPPTNTYPATEWVLDDIQYSAGNETKPSEIQSATERQLEDELYSAVYYRQWDKALAQAKALVKNRKVHVIKSLVNYLIEHKKSSSVEFAYKIWASGGGRVVSAAFPNPFEMVFNDTLVYFTNYLYGLPMHFRSTPDFIGDKVVIGDLDEPLGKEYMWKILPVEVGNRVLFKIQNNLEDLRLKLGSSRNRDGSYDAYGSPSHDNDRHLWYFEPFRHEGQLLFFIVNDYHFQSLKFASKQYHGYRDAISQGGVYHDYPEEHGWFFKIIIQL